MKFGLIGEKLPHSFSPEIHRLLGNDDYTLVEVKREKLSDFLLSRDFCGLNVTIPYKREIIGYLDFVDPYAAQVGAVNTVVNRGGRLYGYNTDLAGMKAMISAGSETLSGLDVFILGSGGTSLAAVCAAKELGAKNILRVSRTREGDGIVSYASAVEMMRKSRHIVINTTPVGMYPDTDGTAIDPCAETICGLYDAVYNPLRTDLIQKAGKMCRVSSGMRMLVTQAVYSDALFFDRKPDVSGIDDIIREVSLAHANIVLTGMPSCGKSTAGRALSEMTRRPFFDTDLLLREKTGVSPAELIRRFGEAHFRELEAGAVAEIDRNITGAVVATGGGTVLDPDNVRRLKHNGVLVFIDREPDLLTADAGHPLTENREMLLSVYAERLPVYRSCADVTVRTDERSGPGELSRAVMKELEYYVF
ncbi:MAG: shikimate dehydrogenase [Clostridia bacterium]|nr:shikimate dehydrogenase [Clostridia bacterium]